MHHVIQLPLPAYVFLDFFSEIIYFTLGALWVTFLSSYPLCLLKAMKPKRFQQPSDQSSTHERKASGKKGEAKNYIPSVNIVNIKPRNVIVGEHQNHEHRKKQKETGQSDRDEF